MEKQQGERVKEERVKEERVEGERMEGERMEGGCSQLRTFVNCYLHSAPELVRHITEGISLVQVCKLTKRLPDTFLSRCTASFILRGNKQR